MEYEVYNPGECGYCGKNVGEGNLTAHQEKCLMKEIVDGELLPTNGSGLVGTIPSV